MSVDHKQAGVRPPLRAIWLAAAGFSLLTVAAGCFVAFSTGAPTLRWGVVVAAWCIGAIAAALIARAPARATGWVVILLAPLALAATLMFDGQSGVQRWIALGPFSLNAAAIVLPATVVALAAAPSASSVAWLSALACLGILIAQPDASQATSFAAAIIFVLARHSGPIAFRLAAIVLALAGAIAAWLMADPLAPVDDVERILHLAWQTAPILAIAMVAALACACLSPALIALKSADKHLHTHSLALVIYLTTAALTPLAGQFPIPLASMSISPVLGFWLGFGLLMAHARLSRTSAT